MLTLAVETSSRFYGAGVLVDDAVVAEATVERRAPEFVDVGVLVGDVLARAGAARSDLDRIAVDVGPGTLSSVRSGLAYVNALAHARDIPVLAVDALSVLAAQVRGAGWDGPVLTLRPGGGDAVYAGLFDDARDPETHYGPVDEVVPPLVAGLDRVAVCGSARGRALPLLAASRGPAVGDTGIDVPQVGALLACVATARHDAPVTRAVPLTERSAVFASPYDQARSALLGGGVVLLPTDTVYGLAVHPERDDAIDRLFALKQRPRTVNLPIMIASAVGLGALGVVVTDPARRLLDAFSPGALTVALGVDADRSPPWLTGRVEVGVRIPADPRLRALLDETGPLLVTSANVHGSPTGEAVEPILTSLAGTPDVVIDGGPRTGEPSTLVNCNLPEPVVEREGSIPAARIARVLA